MTTELGDWLIIVFTGIVAVSTVFYAILTWRLVAETRRMREAQTEPRVSVRVEQEHGGLPAYELVIQNEGQGVAKNVRFEFEGDPTYFRYSSSRRAPPQVDKLTAIKDGLDYLEPSQVYRYPVGIVLPEEFERATEKPWTFGIKYENLQGEQRTNRRLWTSLNSEVCSLRQTTLKI